MVELFRSTNIHVTNECILNFNFLLPSEIIEHMKIKFESKFVIVNSLLHYCGISAIFDICSNQCRPTDCVYCLYHAKLLRALWSHCVSIFCLRCTYFGVINDDD